jgi:hypothetical protein
MKDPIIEEVRKYRMEHTRKFGGNLAAICIDLRQIQTTSGHEVVRLAPKRLDSKRASHTKPRQ